MAEVRIMKHQVTQFMAMKLALKELEPFVRNGGHLLSGRPFARFDGLRSREILANWLICAALNYIAGVGRMHFTSDPLGGDGIIRDKITQNTWPTEHVMVPRAREGQQFDLEQQILTAIQKKQQKGGPAYASGKTLVVFLDMVGEWKPNRLTQALPKGLAFDGIWVVGLEKGIVGGQYSYHVANLDLSQGDAPVWRVTICSNFDDWSVEPIQGLSAQLVPVPFKLSAPQAKL